MSSDPTQENSYSPIGFPFDRAALGDANAARGGRLLANYINQFHPGASLRQGAERLIADLCHAGNRLNSDEWNSHTPINAAIDWVQQEGLLYSGPANIDVPQNRTAPERPRTTMPTNHPDYGDLAADRGDATILAFVRREGGSFEYVEEAFTAAVADVIDALKSQEDPELDYSAILESGSERFYEEPERYSKRSALGNELEMEL